MTNLEAFDLIAAEVFARCYTKFPVGITFEINDFAFDVAPQDRAFVFMGTMTWLQRYGWITIEKNTYAAVSGVQLTEKALYALNWLPDTVKERDRPLIQRIMGALAEQAPASVLGALLGEAMKAFLFPGA